LCNLNDPADDLVELRMAGSDGRSHDCTRFITTPLYLHDDIIAFPGADGYYLLASPATGIPGDPDLSAGGGPVRGALFCPEKSGPLSRPVVPLFPLPLVRVR
jgi:hypothetical protein